MLAETRITSSSTTTITIFWECNGQPAYFTFFWIVLESEHRFVINSLRHKLLLFVRGKRRQSQSWKLFTDSIESSLVVEDHFILTVIIIIKFSVFIPELVACFIYLFPFDLDESGGLSTSFFSLLSAVVI